MNYEEVEMILVGNHAPFTWERQRRKPFYNSAGLRLLPGCLADRTDQPQCSQLKDALIKKHFERKHGPGSYYGQ